MVTQNARFCMQKFKNFPGVIPPDPHGGRGRPPPCTHPQHGLRPCAGALRAPGSAVPVSCSYYWNLCPPNFKTLPTPLLITAGIGYWADYIAFVHRRSASTGSSARLGPPPGLDLHLYADNTCRYTVLSARRQFPATPK